MSQAFVIDQRPRDFSARLSRRGVLTLGLRRRRRHTGRRGLIALAAVAVPALATPDEWRTFDIGDAGGRAVTVEPMPFERRGDSFPGSAFYYLATEEPPAAFSAAAHSDAENAPTYVDPFSGPTARALRIDNSGIDRSRALECLAAAVYYEARSESDQGQRAVAQVVLNRVAHPSYPNTVCGVVYQGSERMTGCQFSFTCDGSLRRTPDRYFWSRAMGVAMAALGGYVERSVGLATHYHTIAIHPYWAPSLTNITTIGAHRFYRFPGAAGQPGAFRFAYRGGEPVAAPHARAASAAEPDPALDPLAIARAYEAGLKTAQGTFDAPLRDDAGQSPAPRSAPPPNYAPDVQRRGGDAQYQAERLPEENQVRPEYRNSGQWISRPGT